MSSLQSLITDHLTHLAEARRSPWRAALASVSRFAASSKRLMAPSDERRELVFSSVKNWRERKVHFRGSKG